MFVSRKLFASVALAFTGFVAVIAMIGVARGGEPIVTPSLPSVSTTGGITPVEVSDIGLAPPDEQVAGSREVREVRAETSSSTGFSPLVARLVNKTWRSSHGWGFSSYHFTDQPVGDGWYKLEFESQFGPDIHAKWQPVGTDKIRTLINVMGQRDSTERCEFSSSGSLILTNPSNGSMAMAYYEVR